MDDVGRHRKGRLYKTMEGQSALRWIREPTKFVTGSDYIHVVKTRINAPPRRSRSACGRPTKERFCLAGCQGITSYLERHFTLCETLFKSDIIAVKNERGIIIDVQVVSTARSLHVAHDDKVRTYGGRDLTRSVRDRYSVNSTLTTSVTLN